jgi:hypothetical protein
MFLFLIFKATVNSSVTFFTFISNVNVNRQLLTIKGLELNNFIHEITLQNYIRASEIICCNTQVH